MTSFKKIIYEKKQAYLQQLNSPAPGNIIDYKRKEAIARREVRKVKRESWQNYIHDIENDLHGSQEKAYRVLTVINRLEKDKLHYNPIPEKEWLNYCNELWQQNPMEAESVIVSANEDVDLIRTEELEAVLQGLKSKKTSGCDNLNSELFKCASMTLKVRF